MKAFKITSVAAIAGILLLLAVFSCQCPNTKEQQSQTKTIITLPKDYNEAKSDLVIAHFSQKPISVKKSDYGKVAYNIRFTDCEYFIVHTKFSPYESKENWQYFCTSSDGSDILLMSIMDLAENKLSQSAYKVIRDYCLQIK